MKKVYLFGCIEKNIGDDLFIYIICKRYKDTRFIISSKAKYLNKNGIDNLEYSNLLKIWNRFASNENNLFIKRFIANLLEKILRLFLKKRDSICIVGNAFKNNNYKGKYQLNWLYNKLKISNNFFLISTNYGPSNSKKWYSDCHHAFSFLDDVCFRDKQSFELFKDLPNIRYAPDAVLSLKLNKNIYIEKKLPSFNDNKYIIISTIDCYMPERPDFLHQFAKQYEDKMVELINCYTNIGYDVVLLNSNSTQDFLSSSRIYNFCNFKDKVLIKNYDGTLDDIFNLYSNASAVIATRLHTIVLSWIYNIPVVPIVYDIKVSNILKTYNFNSLKYEMNEIESANFNTIQNAFKNYDFQIDKSIYEESINQFKKIDILLKRNDCIEK